MPSRQMPPCIAASREGSRDRSPLRLATPWPHQSARLRVEIYLVEQTRIAQRAVWFAPQDRLKVDDLFRSIVKNDTQSVRVEWVIRLPSFNGSMGVALRPDRMVAP